MRYYLFNFIVFFAFTARLLAQGIPSEAAPNRITEVSIEGSSKPAYCPRYFLRIALENTVSNVPSALTFTDKREEFPITYRLMRELVSSQPEATREFLISARFDYLDGSNPQEVAQSFLRRQCQITPAGRELSFTTGQVLSFSDTSWGAVICHVFLDQKTSNLLRGEAHFVIPYGGTDHRFLVSCQRNWETADRLLSHSSVELRDLTTLEASNVLDIQIKPTDFEVISPSMFESLLPNRQIVVRLRE